MAKRPETPRTVKPRTTSPQSLRIIAAHQGELYLERTGEVKPLLELDSLVMSEAPFILAAHNAAQYVVRLDKTYGNHPRWQFRVTPIHREIWKPNNERKAVTVADTVINFFGFQRPNNHQPNRYHQILDPFLFIRGRARKGVTGVTDVTVPSTLMEIYEWAAEVRDWCVSNGISLRPTSGGIAAQLLRDARFYPAARRKVPRATNEQARGQLPGNYYRLYCDPSQRYSATYFDQSASHHACARDLDFPCADSLYAKGRFHTLEGDYWAPKNSELFKRAITEPGLFLLGIENRPGRRFMLPCQEKPGFHKAFVWSNELDYLRETGTLIEGIYAAWTSRTTERGLNQYAEWSLVQTEVNRHLRSWLKPTLLSTYGILAAKPRRTEIGHKRAKGGTPKRYPVGGQLLHVLAKVTAKELESPIANVIHRGMIEAETRLRSIRMAEWLHGYGFQVLAIYADSVFVASETEDLPFPPEGWRVQEHLTNLIFYNEVSFVSDQLTKLPGIPKDDADRLSRIKAASATFKGVADRRAAC